jgi:hypothetical protein
MSAGQASYDELSEQLAATRERLRILAAKWDAAAGDYDDRLGADSTQAELLRRHAGEVREVLGGEVTAASPLEEIRLVLASSGWETSPADVFALVNAARDWRDALEQVDDIVNGDGR